MAIPISEEVQSAQAAPIGLGGLADRFPLDRRSFYYLGNLGLVVLLFLASAGLIVFGFLTSFANLVQFGPQILWKTLQAPLAAGLAAGVVAIILSVRLRNSRAESIELYAHGLSWNHRGGCDSFYWGEIDRLRIRSAQRSFGFNHPRNAAWCRIAVQSKSIILDRRFARVDALISGIQKAVYPGLYMRYAQFYNQGILLNFGAIQLDKAGLIIRQSRFSWGAMAPARIQSGILEFPLMRHPQQRVLRISTGQIENLEVLVAILRYVLKWQEG